LIDKVDSNADDILMADDNADDKTENIVSHRTTEHERVSSWADDADDKNPQSTSSNHPLRFKIGALVRFCGKIEV
jgi:TATA-binding protein-associated factor Taf7